MADIENENEELAKIIYETGDYGGKWENLDPRVDKFEIRDCRLIATAIQKWMLER